MLSRNSVYSIEKITTLRLLTQTIFFVVVNLGLVFELQNSWLSELWLPSAGCYYLQGVVTKCAVYQFQYSLTYGIKSGALLVAPFFFYLLLIAMLGRTWCGWLCPLGFANELLWRLRKKLRIQQIVLSQKHNIYLFAGSYAFLVFGLLISLLLAVDYFSSGIELFVLPICQVCPGKGLFLYLQKMVGIEPGGLRISILATLVLALFLVCGFFIKMFWCRLCPIGAALSIFKPATALWIDKDCTKCTKCGVCMRVCSMGVTKVYAEDKKNDVTAYNCILCLHCVEKCPETNCLSIKMLGYRLATSSYPER